MLAYLWLIPLLPLVGAVTNAALGYKLGRRFVNVVAPAMVGLSFIAAASAVGSLVQLVPEARIVEQTLYRWAAVGDLQVAIALRLDALSAVMTRGHLGDSRRHGRWLSHSRLFRRIHGRGRKLRALFHVSQLVRFRDAPLGAREQFSP